MSRRVSTLLSALLGANLAAWAWAWHAFAGTPALLGAALLAWGFGLRHALDADHIAAIDNVTRRLMENGRRPVVAVGLWFSLGHSAVVAAASLLILLAHGWFGGHAVRLASWGGLAGTLVSAGFLMLIGVANLRVLWSLLRGRHRPHDHADARVHGALSRLLAPVLDRVGGAWGLFGLGLLFGLGFDTATEIGVLSLTATGAGHGGIAWSVMCFPALFAAGMSLIDTLDGMLMLGAYGWALVDPSARRNYNIAITAGSVSVAFGIGLAELAGLLPGADRLLPGWVQSLDTHAGRTGALVVGLFTLLWLAAIGARRLRARPA